MRFEKKGVVASIDLVLVVMIAVLFLFIVDDVE